MVHPHCDINTGKIYGCKKYSRLWWHEKGHIEFNKREETSRLKLYQQYSFLFWMLSTTLSIINKYMLILSLPLMLFYIGIEIYEEIWSNKFANRKVYKD